MMFAGGGTGGHLFPALAIAEEVKAINAEAEVLFVGTKNKIEARVVPEKGYKFASIWISGFRRRFSLENFLFPLKVIVALMQSMAIIRKFKPAVVVGTGGYVSGPVLYAATLRGIPTLIQEQNSYPGATTRFLARRVNEVHLTFEKSRRFFSRQDNLFVSGNPTRRSLTLVSRADALTYFGFPKDVRRVILVVGGSLGARSVNRAMISCIPVLLEKNFQILWQTGPDDFESVKRSLGEPLPPSVRIFPFIDRMDYAYAAGDLVVCRAGATTIAELTTLGKPALLVPYPFAAADHQTENARSLAENGAAEIVRDDELPKCLAEKIVSLFQDDRLRTMSECSRNLGKPAAARDLAVRVLHLAGVA